MQRRNRDMTPRWLTVRFHGVCANERHCHGVVRKGERAFYYPNGKRIYCPSCSETMALDYEARMFDEAVAEAGHSPW